MVQYISSKSLYLKNLIWLEKNECNFWIQCKKTLKSDIIYFTLKTSQTSVI